MRKIMTFALVLCLIFSLSACGGTEDTLHAKFNALYLTDFPQEYMDSPADFAEQIGGFGLEDFASTFADTAAFRCYNAELAVSNSNAFAVNMLGVAMDSKNNGKNGVYFCTYDGGVTIGMPANFDGAQTVFYTVIAEKSLSMEEVLQELGKMDIRCLYVDADTGIESLSEVTEKDPLKEIPITYSK